MSRYNWDRVSRESKYERAAASLDLFLESTVPPPSGSRSGSASLGRVPARLPDGARRDLRRVTVGSWPSFIQAVRMELDRIAHDRALVLATTRPNQFAIIGRGADERYLAVPVSNLRGEAVRFETRGYRLQRTTIFEGTWWVWTAAGSGTGESAGELLWIVTTEWSIAEPRKLWFGAPVVGVYRPAYRRPREVGRG
jgi:hypothetical protein